MRSKSAATARPIAQRDTFRVAMQREELVTAEFAKYSSLAFAKSRQQSLDSEQGLEPFAETYSEFNQGCAGLCILFPHADRSRTEYIPLCSAASYEYFHCFAS